MKIRMFILIAISFFIEIQLHAHVGGHSHSSKVWIINDEAMVGDFIKYENNKVYLSNSNHELKAYEVSSFSQEDVEWIKARSLQLSAINSSTKTPVFVQINPVILFNFLGGILIVLAFMTYIYKKRKFHLAYGFLGMVLILACNSEEVMKDTNSFLKSLPANDVNFLASLFEKFEGLHTESDDDWFYISSNGLPNHNMMVGIENWQQQVPIDQNYTGNNSWAIPIQPVLAENPLSTQTNLLKGAIAIAVNGIPIFNPLNNRGEDANAIGELDQWGGHCGRADDYHYHLPPTHLQSIVGEGNPIAYAVDGFPVYGQTTEELDQYLGRFNADSSYQYHTIQEYPYFIAGMRGEVALDPRSTAPENQVIPQAMTRELRPAKTPLQGAVITDFVSHSGSSYSLTYRLNNEDYHIHYSWDDEGKYIYEFENPDGSSTVETYQR
ncbi:YHYH protein [Membranihabitans marinus]|uniref:YHYH protein n=1 Tax=Membranihabitans marinus TaxID=1227546 RepID=UPI001F2C4FB8|nr:YHYH protein [Membranihabitans marinus]